MKRFYTDGQTVAEAPHRAGAFDKLQEVYGNSDIGDIFTAYFDNADEIPEGFIYFIYMGKGYTYDPNELQWKEEDKDAY